MRRSRSADCVTVSSPNVALVSMSETSSPAGVLLGGIALLVFAAGLFFLLPRVHDWIGNGMFRDRYTGPAIVAAFGLLAVLIGAARLL